MLENNASMLKIKRKRERKAKAKLELGKNEPRENSKQKKSERESLSEISDLATGTETSHRRNLQTKREREREREREASLFFSFLFRVLVYYFKEEDVVGVALQITLINSACALKICNCDQSKGRLFNLQKRNVLILLCVVMETYRRRSKARTIERQTKKRITIFFFLFSIFLTYLNDDIINK